jgi:membrane-bound metal-dependent hydrolase YbcI (DUF457 family)
MSTDTHVVATAIFAAIADTESTDAGLTLGAFVVPVALVASIVFLVAQPKLVVNIMNAPCPADHAGATIATLITCAEQPVITIFVARTR